MEIESPAAPMPTPQEGSDRTSDANTEETIALDGLTEEEYWAALKKNGQTFGGILPGGLKKVRLEIVIIVRIRVLLLTLR